MKNEGRDEATALTGRAERRRVDALAAIDPIAQAALGQYFTPTNAAALIADVARLPTSGCLRILDPGAGTGVLATAMAARILRSAPGVELEIVAIEMDESLAPVLKASLQDLEETADSLGVVVRTRAIIGDFIELATGFDALHGPLAEGFDLVIMNPPYGKLGLRSTERRALASHGVDCPNLYAAFMAIAAQTLSKNGQLIAITPRSFANGPYFAEFRKYFLGTLSLDRIHVFESRSTVFADTGVLQENIIVGATKSARQPHVVLSESVGHGDKIVSREVAYDDVVQPGDPANFIRIMTSDEQHDAAEVMAGQPCSLTDLGLQVSTGRVVDFRAKERLRPEPSGVDGVPLIYPGNVREGEVQWPKAIRKPQGFDLAGLHNERKYVLPEGIYVLVKRFSAKEERRRVVAGVWLENHGNVNVAIENHLNFFHHNGRGLERDLAIGLSYWLNSTVVDQFFRTFSGHTQVNAADLRSMRYPSAASLRQIGAGRPARLPSQLAIDEAVAVVTRQSA